GRWSTAFERPPRRLKLSLVVWVALTAIGLGAIAGVSWVTAGAALAASRRTMDCSSATTCFTPRQLEVAYGILPLLGHGTNGKGETVVLPELAEPQFPAPTSDIRRDLAAYDKVFRLPAARVRVVSTLAPSASPWLANGEEVLDSEVVHAVAPGAAIVELLVKGSSLTNAKSAVAAA